MPIFLSDLDSASKRHRDSTYEGCSKASEEGMVGSFSEQGSGGASDAAHAGVHCYAQPQGVQGICHLHTPGSCNFGLCFFMVLGVDMHMCVPEWQVFV